MILPLNLLDQLDLLDPHPGDDEHDERAFRQRQAMLGSMGWYVGELERLVGFLRVLPVTFQGRRFDLDVQGGDAELAVMIGVLGDREEIIDAIAWPVDQPARWTTYAGRAPALGWLQLLDHPVRKDAPSLRVFRTPLAWLLAGGEGVVPIDMAQTAREIRAAMDAGGKIKPEDDAHAAEIADAIKSLTDFGHLVVDVYEAA